MEDVEQVEKIRDVGKGSEDEDVEEEYDDGGGGGVHHRSKEGVEGFKKDVGGVERVE